MAGLESIALAVDFLEQRASRESNQAALQPQPSLAPPSPTAAPIPPRTGFLNAPRRVSSDSISEEQQQITRSPTRSPENVPSQSGQEPAIADSSMSPEMISRMVEQLADDGEFQGPPPPPPAATETITKVMDCDVLCGRGGETNHHSGNVKYRSLVKKYQPLYIMSKRRDKPLIASKIVRLVRHMGGRFLRKDKTNAWRDVGNTKAREKTSQALREGAPDLRSPQSTKAGGAGSKEERAVSQVDISPPRSSLGVRKQSDLGVGYAAAGMGLYPVGAPVVEPRAGEIDRSFKAPKKMRMEVMPAPAPMAGLPPHFWAGAQHAFLHGMATPPSQFMTAAAPACTLGPNPPLVSPHPFAPTVSADDDDSKSSEEQQAPRPKTRGPRLKLLKKRLQEEQSGN